MTSKTYRTMSDSSSDTGDLDVSCSFSSVDSDQSEFQILLERSNRISLSLWLVSQTAIQNQRLMTTTPEMAKGFTVETGGN